VKSLPFIRTSSVIMEAIVALRQYTLLQGYMTQMRYNIFYLHTLIPISAQELVIMVIRQFIMQYQTMENRRTRK